MSTTGTGMCVFVCVVVFFRFGGPGEKKEFEFGRVRWPDGGEDGWNVEE